MEAALDPRLDAALADEAAGLLQELIRLDTTNPPGRETLAAVHLRDYLEGEGIACELVARDPDRANLIARIPGTGDGPSLTLLGHTDVVYADAAAWSVDPFGGDVKDGHVWGRGALDMKSHTACNAVAFALLARSGFRPRGDLILIAEADEEDGSAEVGLPFVIAERPDIRTDYALNEGAGDRLVLPDGRVVYAFTSAEKATMPVRVTVRGVAGHASLPGLGDNALLKLAPVLERLSAYEPVQRGSIEVDALLDAVVPGDDAYERRIERARAVHPVLDAVLPALLGSTMVPTLAQASLKRNVVPAEASVVCDCRTLPGTTVDELFGEFRAALSGLDVELSLAEEPVGGTRSPLGTPLEAVCRSFVDRLEPGAGLAPMMCTGFTNSHYLREAFGTVAYGFFPLRSTDPSLLDTVHAADERIARDDLAPAVRFLEHAARSIGSTS